MNRYTVLLTDELEEVYKNIAQSLDISMEQTLAEALQVLIERKTLKNYPKTEDSDKFNKIVKRG